MMPRWSPTLFLSWSNLEANKSILSISLDLEIPDRPQSLGLHGPSPSPQSKMSGAREGRDTLWLVYQHLLGKDSRERLGS